jgi:hypothetical protein
MDNTDKTVITDSKQSGDSFKPVETNTDTKKFSRPSSSAATRNFSPNPNKQPASHSVSLGSRLIRLQTLILAAGFLIGIYLSFALMQLVGAHSLFEAAQLQRVLNQRYAKEILLASSGVPVNYERTAEIWQKTLTVLTHGGAVPTDIDGVEGLEEQRVQPPMGAAKFSSALQHLSDLRKKIVLQSNEFMESRLLSQHRQELFDELYRQSLELQAAGDAVVKTYDQHLNSGVSWWDVNAVAVELAERQRMLIQQHIKEVLFVAHGIPADYQATRLRLYETARILTEGGSLRIDGGSTIAVPAPTNADVVFNLEQQKTAIERFTAVSNQFLMLSNEDVERSIQLKGLSDSSAEFHAAATKLLADYRGFFNEKVQKAQRNALAAGILAAIFALFLVWTFAAKYVDEPARKLAAALAAIRSGRRSHQPVGSAGDSGPLSDVAREIDSCSELMRSRQAWFESFVAAGNSDDLKDPGAEDPVAARLYEWYKARGGSLQDISASSSRWSRDEAADNDITIIGRLPDTDNSGSINDSELLDQLIQRANELQAQNERLFKAHSDLETSADALRGDQAQSHGERQRLLEENGRLTARVAEQARALEGLRQQIEGLQGTESTLRSGADAVQRLNIEFEERVLSQAEELSSLKSLLAKSEEALKERIAEHSQQHQMARDEMHTANAQIEILNVKLTEVSGELSKRLGERDSLAKRLADAEARLIQIESMLDAARAQGQAVNEAALAEQESARKQIEELRHKLAEAERVAADRLEEREALSLQLSNVEADLTAQSLEAEKISQILDNEREMYRIELEGLRSKQADVEHFSEQLKLELTDYQTALQRQSDSNQVLTSDNQKLMEQLNASRRAEADLDNRHQSLQSEYERLMSYKAVLEHEKNALDESLSELRRNFENLAELRSSEAARYEQAAERLQESLRAQSQAVLSLRTQLGQALTQHSLDMEARGEELKAVSTQLEGRETELWISQRELSAARAELISAKAQIETLIGVEQMQTKAVHGLETGLAELQSCLDKTSLDLQAAENARLDLRSQLERSSREHADECQRLASELAALKAAYVEKAQALASTEERLQTTRAALKTTLEDLQERAKP